MDLKLNQLMGSHTYLSAEALTSGIIQSHEALQDLNDVTWQIDQMVSTINQLVAIRHTIKLYGCTESIRYLYGDNDIYLSVEGIGEKISSGLKAAWNKILEWINRAINFFKRLFGIGQKQKEALKETKQSISKNTEKVNEVEKKRPEEKQEPVYQPKYATTSYLNQTINIITDVDDPDQLNSVLEKLNEINKELQGPIWDKPSSAQLRMDYCDFGLDAFKLYENLNQSLTTLKIRCMKFQKDGEASEDRLKKCNKVIQLYPKVIKATANIVRNAYNVAARGITDPDHAGKSNLFEASMTVGKISDVPMRIG